MVRLLVLYGQPQDPAAFDDYYDNKHVPLALTIPGIREYTVSRPTSATPDTASPYHLIAELDFDSPEAMQAAFGSPEGQAAVADVATFANGGVTMLVDSRQSVMK